MTELPISPLAAWFHIATDEQLFVETSTTTHVHDGPDQIFLWPFTYKKAWKRKATSLGSLEYAVVKNILSGAKRVERGPKLNLLKPFDEEQQIGETFVQKALSLKATEFVKLKDETTGNVRVVRGETVLVPGPNEVAIDGPTIAMSVRSAFNLKFYEWVRVEDKRSGATRVERGEQLVFLSPFEEFVTPSPQRAIEVDDDTAVLVRNIRSGQQHLVTEKQLYIPAADGSEEILEKRHLRKLADYEACIVRGKDGTDTFFFGKHADQRSFFLPPYSHIVEHCWSRGRRREKRDLKLTTIDLRPVFMSFEFNCRTSDNVELVLEGSFFWEIVDLQAMMKFTSDTTGDVCNHARSKFIERVSKVTLRQFMENFNGIAEQVHKEDDAFYRQRGVLIHSLEVTGYHCAESSTARILEQIIQETTNRMNRLQQQESENEVQLFQIQGEIEEERAKQQLLEVQMVNSSAKSRMEGLAEAERCKSFFEAIEDKVPDLDMRVALWSVLRKEDALKAVSSGGAQLWYTPSDVNLSIEAGLDCRAKKK